MKWVNLRGFMRTVHGCPQEWRLTRAVSDGPDQKLGRHLDGCTSCAKIYSDLKAIVKVAPALSPADPMTDDSRERIAAMLLAEASAGERSAPVVRRAKHLALVVALRNDAMFAAADGLPYAHGAEDAALDPRTPLYTRAAAEELVQARAEALERMRRTGAIVIDISPTQMTAAVVNRYLELKSRGAL